MPGPWLHDDAGVDAFGQQEGGGRVPPILQPHLSDTCAAQQDLPRLPVRPLVDGPSVDLREDEVVLLLPERAGRLPLLELGRPVPRSASTRGAGRARVRRLRSALGSS